MDGPKLKNVSMDTGASYTGPITLMDIDKGEYWQSDPVNFYPGIKARGHSKFFN
jgi:hypothetical protein